MAGKMHYRGFRVVGHDPGPDKYGYGVVEVNHNWEPYVFGSGMLTETIKTFTDPLEMAQQTKNYGSAIRKITGIDDTKLRLDRTAVVAERYQTRSIRGMTIELVTTMNTLNWSMCLRHGIPMRLIVAGNWKNAWNKYFGQNLQLDAMYRRGEVEGLSPHRIDGILMGIYMANGLTYQDIQLTRRFWNSWAQSY